jgi:hypothetical protein
MGISKTKMIASRSQPGPTESGSGKAQYTPAAASMATNAGHRGSRMIGLLMTVRGWSLVQFSLRLKRMGHYRLPRCGPEMFGPGGISFVLPS